MKMHTIEIEQTHKQESDGTHTLILTISGMTSVEAAAHVGRWFKTSIEAHADEFGVLQLPPLSSRN